MSNIVRVQCLDVMRGIGICAVILGHVLQRLYGIEDPNPTHKAILIFQMPLFFVIAGYVSALSENNLSFDSLLLKKIYRLLLPYLSWVSISLIVRLSFGGSWSSVDSHWIIDHYLYNEFWFLRVLFYVTLIYIVVMRLSHQYPKIEMLVLGVLLGLSLFLHGSIAAYLFYFIVGVIIERVRDRVVKAMEINLKRVYLSSVIVFGLLCVAGTRNLRAAALAGCLAILLISIILERNKRLGTVLAFIGKKSLALYAIHWWIFFGILPIPMCPSGLPLMLYALIVSLFWLGASLLIDKILSNITLGKLLLGTLTPPSKVR